MLLAWELRWLRVVSSTVKREGLRVGSKPGWEQEPNVQRGLGARPLSLKLDVEEVDEIDDCAEWLNTDIAFENGESSASSRGKTGFWSSCFWFPLSGASSGGKEY